MSMTLNWFDLRFPLGIQPEQATTLIRSLTTRGRSGLLSAPRPIVFELTGTEKRTSWQIGLPRFEAKDLRTRIEQSLPGVAVLPARRSAFRDGVAIELQLRSQRRQLRADLQAEITAAVLAATGRLRKDEQATVQWVIGGWLPRSPIVPKPEQGRSPGLLELDRLGVPILNTEEISEARKKQTEQLFACVGRIAVQGATAQRSRSVISQILGAYQLLRVSGSGLSRRWLPSWWVRSRLERGVVSPLDPPCVLRADELVAVLGWPLGDEPIAGVEQDRSRLLRPDRRVLSTSKRADLRAVAASAYPSEPGRLVLDRHSALRHLHVVGPTGVGKSTLLAQLILQDITAGYGTVVVDPKGDLVDDVLARLPEDRLGSVAVLDPSDAAPLGLNPLAFSGAAGVDGLLSVMHSLWKSSWGPRLHDILHAGLITLSLTPGHSLVELPLLLINPSFRRPLVARAVKADPLGLGGFWSWFDGLSEDQASQVLGPVMNKLRAFILRPELRAVLGQVEPRFDLCSIFTNKRSLLVKLPKGQIGSEAAALLGSIVVHQVWQHTLKRSGIPASKRRPVFLYLDEFQEFVRLPLDLGDALAQARGLGVGLTLAHQHFGQLDKDTRAAVLANAGSRVAFRLDHDDARVIAKRGGGVLKSEDFAHLAPFHAYADLIAEDVPRGWASARTVRLSSQLRSPQDVLTANRQRWGVPRSETAERLEGLLRSEDPAAAVGTFGVIPGDGDQS